MNYINSTANQKIVHAKKLGQDKKYRHEAGEFLVEGIRWINELIKYCKDAIEAIFILEEEVGRIDWIDGSKCELSDKLFYVPQNLLEKIATTKESQVAIAIAKIKKEKDFEFGNRVLFLDGISDPGNVGTIIRTGVASGFSDIILDKCVDVYNPKVVRSTMGALLHANILEADSAKELIELKKNGYSILIADIKGQNIFEFKQSFDKIVLAIGSEAHGISNKIKKMATHTLSIPMNSRVESLNAGVSAGIIMYQFKR